jgi:hypothetical protein
MPQFSDEAVEFFRNCYHNEIYKFTDDPDEVCVSPDDAVEYYQLLVNVGKELGLDFWVVALEETMGHASRLNHLKNYLAESSLYKEE